MRGAVHWVVVGDLTTPIPPGVARREGVVDPITRATLSTLPVRCILGFRSW